MYHERNQDENIYLLAESLIWMSDWTGVGLGAGYSCLVPQLLSIHTSEYCLHAEISAATAADTHTRTRTRTCTRTERNHARGK